MTRLRPVAGALVLGLAVAACGDSGGAKATLPVEDIRPAIAAVEASLGGPQTFSEVNVTPSEVNVFVVRDGTDLAYVVRDGVVEAPPSGVPYEGPTFTAADVGFEDTVLDRVTAELVESELVAFSVTPGATGGVDYIATVKGKTQELRLLLAADGTVLSA